MISDDHHLVFLQVLLLIGDGDDGHWPMIINQRGVENHDHHDKRKVRLGAMAGGILPRAPSIVQPLLIII